MRVQEETPPSTIEEEKKQEDESLVGGQEVGSEIGDLGGQPVRSPERIAHLEPAQDGQRNGTATRPAANGHLDARATAARENESLKAKLRIMEKKRQEDREKFKTMDNLQADKDRFENIIQALQKKLKMSQQELVELRDQYAQLESKGMNNDDRSAEHESEIELVTLDKEMAEERAETYRTELDSLKMRHEELELETDILREENRELGSVMSPEERASAGWIQMERERDRLRDALVLLRDMTQQSEGDLKAQVKELQEDLSIADRLKSDFEETSAKLSKAEATNKHIMEQLEAVETNEEVTVALEHEKEANIQQIHSLKQQIQELLDEAQVSAELEEFHLTAEKELQAQLDETQAVLHERQQHTIDQERSIGDLEYTLIKFREVVSGLQNDTDELRRSREISAVEAHEMSSKSRAMMGLNLQLQNSAAKTQMKAVDAELERIRAEERMQHLTILQLFVTDQFEGEKGPMLTLLTFQRIKSKARLITSLLKERIRDRPHLTADEPFVPFEVIEKISKIAGLCSIFASFVSSCDVSSFRRMNAVLPELEPVEKAVDGWVQALRQDEMGRDSPEQLQRTIGILQDLGEKFIEENMETKSADLIREVSLVEAYCDSSVGQLGVLTRTVQTRLGTSTDDNEESIHFDKKMDQLLSKMKTARYIASKIDQNMNDMESRSICLGEETWVSFEEAMDLAEQFSSAIRRAGKAAIDLVLNEETDEPPTYVSVIDAMSNAVRSDTEQKEDIFATLTSYQQQLQSRIDNLLAKSQDLSLTSEFERHIHPPWVAQANAVRAQRIIAPEIQEELNRLKTRLQDQTASIASKDRQLEEQQISIELLESRTKDTKMHADVQQKLEIELAAMTKSKQQLEQEVEQSKTEFDRLRTELDAHVAELEVLRTSGAPINVTSTLSSLDQTAILDLKAQNATLQVELTSLQAAVRWLKDELHRSKMPVDEIKLQARELAWLDPTSLWQGDRKRRERARAVKEQANGVFEKLLNVAESVKPVVLKARTETASVAPPGPAVGEATKKTSTWRAMKDTPRYQVLRQREDLERWEAARSDFVRRVRLEQRSTRRPVRVLREVKGYQLPAVSEEKDGVFPAGGGDGVSGLKVVGASSP